MSYKYTSGSVRRGDIYYEDDDLGAATYIDFGMDSITLRPSGSAILHAEAAAVGVNVTDPDTTLEVNGAVHLSGEVSTPNAPADGDGGILYPKTDGKLYWRSNEVAETDLTAGGGGGGISFNGSTANGVVTYGSSTTADVESNLLFNGSKLAVVGAISGSGTLQAVGATTLGGTLHVSGAVTLASAVVYNRTEVDTSATTTATLAATDYYVGVNKGTGAAQSCTITLPAVGSHTGKVIIIKDEDGDLGSGITLTIEGDGSETIDGTANKVMTTPYAAITLLNNGTQWSII